MRALKFIRNKVANGLFLISCLLPVLTWANSWDVFITVGPDATRLSNKQELQINPYVINAYEAKPQTHWDAFGGIGFSHTFEKHSYAWSLGLAGYAIGLGDNLQGTEYPLINQGLFDTLDYQFHVSNQSLMAESRLLYTHSNWQPFFLGGIGQAWNHVNQYAENPTDPASSAVALSPAFQSNTKEALAYELGVGLQHLLFKNFTQRYNASIGYRYFSLGQGQFDPMSVQTTIVGLQTKTLTTQGIALSLAASFY